MKPEVKIGIISLASYLAGAISYGYFSGSLDLLSIFYLFLHRLISVVPSL